MGELLPYGTTGLVFKDGNESTELQEEYYAYLNRYVRENNIPGVYYEDDSKVLEGLDKLTEMMSELMEEYVYMEKGTNVLGDVADGEHIEIIMDEPEVKPRKKKG